MVFARLAGQLDIMLSVHTPCGVCGMSVLLRVSSERLCNTKCYKCLAHVHHGIYKLLRHG